MKPSKSALVPQKPFTRKENVAKKLQIDDEAEEDDGGSCGGAPSADQQRCPFYVSLLNQKPSL